MVETEPSRIGPKINYGDTEYSVTFVFIVKLLLRMKVLTVK